MLPTKLNCHILPLN